MYGSAAHVKRRHAVADVEEHSRGDRARTICQHAGFRGRRPDTRLMQTII